MHDISMRIFSEKKAIFHAASCALFILFLSCTTIDTDNPAHTGTENYYIYKPVADENSEAGIRLTTQVTLQGTNHPVREADDSNIGLDTGVIQVLSLASENLKGVIEYIFFWGADGYGGCYTSDQGYYYGGTNLLAGFGLTWNWGRINFSIDNRAQFLAEFGPYQAYLEQLYGGPDDHGDYAILFEDLLEEELKFIVQRNFAFGFNELFGPAIVEAHMSSPHIFCNISVNFFIDFYNHSIACGLRQHLALIDPDKITIPVCIQYTYHF